MPAQLEAKPFNAEPPHDLDNRIRGGLLIVEMSARRPGDFDGATVGHHLNADRVKADAWRLADVANHSDLVARRENDHKWLRPVSPEGRLIASQIQAIGLARDGDAVDVLYPQGLGQRQAARLDLSSQLLSDDSGARGEEVGLAGDGVHDRVELVLSAVDNLPNSRVDMASGSPHSWKEQYDSPFAGQVVWITGAASGIGAHLSTRFAAAGATVAALDVDQAGLDALCGQSQGISAVTVDVGSWEATSASCERLVDDLGPPRVAVANAGIAPAWVPVIDADPAEWSRVIEVNLTGAFHIAKAASRHLRETAPSSLLFTSSVMGLGAGPGGAAYQASKHAVVGLMRTLANELGPDGVRVNALCPGWVNTPMLDADIAEADGDRDAEISLRVRNHLLPRLIEPEDVAEVALFLASPAGAVITGISLPVDAGMLEERQWTVQGSSWAQYPGRSVESAPIAAGTPGMNRALQGRCDLSTRVQARVQVGR
jgi:NAD(P)-dependent dehydrogenase (short-subunit alcohol dehydrogenase family)